MKNIYFHSQRSYRKTILLSAIAIIFSGCTLEDAHIVCGQSNNDFLGFVFDDLGHPVNSLDELSEKSMNNAQKESYISSLLVKNCPENWYCIDMHDSNGTKIGEACNPCNSDKEILCTNECRDIYTSQDHCGACNHKCQDYEVCVNGSCEEVTKCEYNEHAYQGSCEENTIENCGKHGVACAETINGWADGLCKNGECYAMSCKKDYKNDNGKCAALMSCRPNEHVYINTCEADDLKNCGEHGKNCLGMDGVESANCLYSECVATSCKEGFCLSGNKCVEGFYSPKTCGITGGACEVCAAGQACSKGKCVTDFCDKHQHLYEGDCEADDIDNCGAHGLSCVFSNAKTKVCDEGTCKVQECEDNYHIFENSCELDDPNNCGSHENACASQIDGWKSGKCESHQCVLQSCQNGHVYENACEADDMDNCGRHGNSCKIDRAISECINGQCKLIKCEAGHYEYHGQCLETQAEGGAVIDPWGLIWDNANREGAHTDADKICKNLGARLPTPTEIMRNSPTSGFAGVIGTAADTVGIWSDTTHNDAGYVEAISLATAEISKVLPSAKNNYRCVWDPIERPKTFTGVNCHGAPDENGCQEVEIGSIKYLVDRRDRPGQSWLQAAEECHRYGARLPWVAEYPALISFGLSNGSGNAVWSTSLTANNAGNFKWVGSVTSADINNFDKNVFSKKYAFRCMSEPLKLDIAGLPVFPQTKIKNNDNVIQVGPTLWIDKIPRESIDYYEAEHQCMLDGGRVASYDELSFAVKNGLLKPGEDKGDTTYFTSSPAHCTDAAKSCHIGFKFGSTAAPYFFPEMNSKISLEAAKKYYCTYRPEINLDFTNFEKQVTDKVLQKVSASGVDYYLDTANSTLNANAFNGMLSAMRSNMRLPTDAELVFMIKSGAPDAAGAAIMTSKFAYYSDSSLFGFATITWKGEGSEDFAPYKNFKYYRHNNVQTLTRKFVSTIAH